LTTNGINHLGLTVRDLDQTTSFFTDLLGWKLVTRDDSYPRTAVTDGTCRFTLWQADLSQPVTGFDRKTNVGLHHVAIEVASREDLFELAEKIRAWPGVVACRWTAHAHDVQRTRRYPYGDHLASRLALVANQLAIPWKRFC
jgi:lactoylglutathione lyase